MIRISSDLRRVAWAVFLMQVVAVGSRAEEANLQFKDSVEPILRKHCWDCHGPEEQESRFRVDRLSSLLAGGDSGEPAVVPGNVDGSYLLKLVRHQESGKEMPPGDRLTDAEIGLIERWISGGAKTPADYGPAKQQADLSHWSFQPVARVKADGVDELILRRLKQKGLSFSPRASRRTLIRRLYLVMLGVPPTPQQVESFLRDDRDQAWSHLVDEVLQSPQYGERWAAHWLDLVRFGETHGFETNRERPHAWHFRDWVIRSFNDDKPYDRFVREQIAGDAHDAAIGTGFLVAGPYDLVKGADPRLGLEQRMNELDDMINTTGTAFLGLTTGCARCHSHKFDPISQRDYYALQAVFAGVVHGDQQLPLSEETKTQVANIDSELRSLRQRLQGFIPRVSNASLVLQESNAKYATEPAGIATKPGQADQTLGGRTYAWWNNQPGAVIAEYRPGAKGRYRIWLSWGAGHRTHSTDAKYVLRSGEEDTVIATVNQQLDSKQKKFSAGTRWSGLYDAGVHSMDLDDSLVLIGGSGGQAVTADAIILQPVSPGAGAANADQPIDVAIPSKRRAVNAKKNVERFPPRLARFVRFRIGATSGAEGCIDELEVFSGDRNVALATAGAKATSSANFVHPKHKLLHVNDGQFGNDRSWIVGSKQGGWVQVQFSKPERIDRVVWGRDRTGMYGDRLPVSYRIESAMEEGRWELLSTADDREPFGATESPTYRFDGLPESEADQGRRWLAKLEKLKKNKARLETTSLVYAGKFTQPGPTHRLYRGEPEAKRERVGPNTIEAFGSLDLPMDAPEQVRRKALADWIVDESNPLTARVIVNRIWQFHFGTGIVDTPSDFGRNGSEPSHPRLLDYLARQLVSHDWSLKHIHRLILMSQTWQQDNRPRPEAQKIDAGSRWLWRFPPRRLEAEAIRDSILSVTGVLDLENAGGPGFSPFQVEMENVRHYHAKQKYGPEDWRRMIYMTKVRQEREHVFGAFDCPDASMVVAKRSRSTTPLQALNLLNSHFVMQQAELLANRLGDERQGTAQQIGLAWQLCFQREPSEPELAECLRFIEQHGLKSFSRAILNSNEFVFIP